MGFLYMGHWLFQKTNTQENCLQSYIEHAELSEIECIAKELCNNLIFWIKSHYFYTGEKTERI